MILAQGQDIKQDIGHVGSGKKMRITRNALNRLIESFLLEQTKGKYVCPNCGHKHEEQPTQCANCTHPWGKDWSSHPEYKEKNESIFRALYEQVVKFVCPEPTKSVGLNTANRDRAIKADFITYGPLNVNEPGDYWKKISEKWDTSVEAAKISLCGNCVAFDTSPQMEECMPGEVEEDDDGGRLGYCWMHHFKCHSMRTCNTWAKGGPISTDEVSLEFFERNKEGALNKEPIDPDIYEDE